MRQLAWLMAGWMTVTMAAETVKVESFSPEGLAKEVRQVQVRFSAAAVDFGDPRRADPFDIQCAEKGKGRWVDAENWVYDFERALPAGTSCRFNLKAGLKAPSGAALTASRHEFSTGSPAIINNWPNVERRVDEEQAFLLEFDGPVRAGSLTQLAHCDVEGIKERIGVKTMADNERVALIKTLVRKPEGRYFEALRCQRKLPAGRNLKLVIDAGLPAANGVSGGDKQELGFSIRPEFAATLRCERSNAKANCLPILPLRLAFSAPVAWASAGRIVLKDAEGKSYAAQPADEDTRKRILLLGKAGDATVLDPIRRNQDVWVDAVQFVGPFPEKSTATISLPPGLKDDAGRSLANARLFPLAVKIDAFPPLAKFSGNFGIVERNAGGLLPVTVRNLNNYTAPTVAGQPAAQTATTGTLAPTFKQPAAAPAKPAEAPQGAVYRVLNVTDEAAIIGWYRRLQRYEEGAAETSWIAGDKGTLASRLPTPASNREAEVIGIPMSKPGFNLVEVESPRLGASLLDSGKTMYVRTGALSTNLAVHLKRGEENSLVWVTTLDQAYLMKDATVSVRDCNGRSLWAGKTDKNGIARIAQTLPRDWNCPLYAFARKGDDLGMVSSEWDSGIEPWRFGFSAGGAQGAVAFHTVFDRNLLRAGDTVHMKHVARKRVMLGFAELNPKDLPNRVRIEHVGSGQQYDFPLDWKGGAAESAWAIPAKATLGEYSVMLYTRQGKEERGLRQSGSFRVGEFRLPLMQAFVKGPATPQVNPTALPLDIQVNYLNGGGAAGAKVKLRQVLRPRFVQFAGYDGFRFAEGDVPEAMKKGGSVSRGAYTEDGDYFDDEGTPQASNKDKPLPEQALTLDRQGAARVQTGSLPALTQPSELLAELEYPDPNGEIQTARAAIPLWPSRYVAGVKIERFSDTREVPVTALVLDTSGKPVANAPVQLNAYLSRVFSHRKRLVGGFYAYENQTEYKPLGVLCNTRTDAKGMAHCQFTGRESGDVTIRVGTKDADGKYAFSHAETWFNGEDSAWFGGTASDRIDVIPDKPEYQPGETAALQVRMPFQNATALIAVEREGVIDSYVQSLSSANPVVKVPIKAHFAPNAYISVLVLRGRVGGVQPTALVDLGKPSYRLGIAAIKVGHKGATLNVKVEADRAVYQARDKARVTVKVAAPDGKPLPKGAEVALAAVDEGLLELSPNDSWDLLDAMMAPRGYDILNATAQMQVIGRRHFGKKALPAGGGGGLMPTRELFDTLLLWKGRVVLDDKGEASVEVPLNDSLTSFRIVAIATAGSDRFGTGATSIRSTRDLMLLSGLPPVVREADEFRAGFTLRNTTDRAMKVRVTPQATAAGQSLALSPQTETLPPHEAKEIAWNVSVPVNTEQLDWLVTAEEEGGKALDRVKLAQKVYQAVPVRVFQATLKQLDGSLSLPVALPDDAIAGRGSVNVGVKAKLADSLDGVERYMRHYWYSCLEQRASRAIALHDKALWDAVTADLPVFLDEQGFAKYFAILPRGSVELTAYLLALSHESGWALPQAQQEKMESALIGYVEGRVKPEDWPWGNATVSKLMALDALSRTSKVRANLLDSLDLRPATWASSSLLDWIGILKRTPELPSRDARLKEALQLMRNRLNLQGTVMALTTDKTDKLWWAMQSGDVNAVRLLLATLDEPGWQADLPRIANGALGRQIQGHWDLTTANAWGRLAYDKFSARFESTPVAGQTVARLAGKQETLDWGKTPRGQIMSLPWPKGRGELAVSQQGTGKPWLTLQSLAAVPLKQPLFTGYRIAKTLTPVVQQQPGQWSRGDVVRVHLDIEALGEMGWVAVNDPIPAGSTLLNRGLRTDSAILSADEQQRGAWPAYTEAAFDAYRAYYDWLPSGKWSLDYTFRLNNSGSFNLPPTRVEAMYAPEMFGELPNAGVTVK
ncbi:MG2 domain-containing protein [Chitinivorax sp. PXF-14]|uniref:alpha-2-macroglobulin family protein n=1 Tax=Chitinivorax sp. PXF-14 TaxID=3230488 RepID=UPI00346705AA